jgi:hypothetical protein
MNLKFLIVASLLSSGFLLGQNDVDALRYSRISFGGSARYIGMGGAMGALGGDVSCATTNPAALGIFRKGEVVYTGGLHSTINVSKFNNSSARTPYGNLAFGNFGLAVAYGNDKDPTKRNVFCFSNTQLLNFTSEIQIHDAASRNSIATDMVNIANQTGPPLQLNPAYEQMAYNSYVMDYDASTGKYVSLVDAKRNVNLTRNISTTGRMNEINISLAQSADDKYYFGGSLGIPRIRFSSTTSHYESDPNDSMRIGFTSPNTYTTTYVDGIPTLDTIYRQLGGFESLSYKESFRTDGYGFNLKLGGVVRINSECRVGAYFHTPTMMYLTDTYSYTMVGNFDSSPQSQNTQFPYEDEIGKSIYRVITPLRYGINGAYIVNKTLALGLDIEEVNYGNASISSTTPSDYAGVNTRIKQKYKNATNIRAGAELNIKPVMVRAGYAMYGSPFGGLFTGPFDRQTASIGLGFRTKSNFFFDAVWSKTFTKEAYYMYDTGNSKTDLSLSTVNFFVSAGLRF